MKAKEFTEPQAAGCILYAEDTGRWGLQQRSNTVSDPGVWSTWGGGRQRGESPEQCVRRELAEESGYQGQISLTELSRNPDYITFLARVPREFDPRPCYEVQDYCWVQAGQWPKPMHPAVAPILQKLIG